MKGKKRKIQEILALTRFLINVKAAYIDKIWRLLIIFMLLLKGVMKPMNCSYSSNICDNRSLFFSSSSVSLTSLIKSKPCIRSLSYYSFLSWYFYSNIAFRFTIEESYRLLPKLRVFAFFIYIPLLGFSLTLLAFAST